MKIDKDLIKWHKMLAGKTTRRIRIAIRERIKKKQRELQKQEKKK